MIEIGPGQSVGVTGTGNKEVEIEAAERRKEWITLAAAALTGLLAANHGIGVVALSRELADAMQAEADKRRATCEPPTCGKCGCYTYEQRALCPMCEKAEADKREGRA